MPDWLIGTYVLLWMSALVVGMQYRRRVREVDPESAARLHPGLTEKSARSDVVGLAFLLRGEYRRLRDPTLARLGDVYRALLASFVVILVVTLAVFVAR